MTDAKTDNDPVYFGPCAKCGAVHGGWEACGSTRAPRFLIDFDCNLARVVMVPFWWLRRAFKWLAVPLGVNDRLIEACTACGIQQPFIWHAPHDIWEAVTDAKRWPDGEWAPGVLCPRCFDREASKRGLLLCWVPMRHGDDAPFLESPTSHV